MGEAASRKLIMQADRSSKVETYGGRVREATPFRLTPAHVKILRRVFCDLESEAGIRTRYWVDFERATGARGSKQMDEVHLFDAERYCEEQNVFHSGGREVSRCRAALRALAQSADGRTHVLVLFRLYGPVVPHARYELWPEVAALAEYTPVVSEAHAELVEARITERTQAARSAGLDSDALHDDMLLLLGARRIGILDKMAEQQRLAASDWARDAKLLQLQAALELVTQDVRRPRLLEAIARREVYLRSRHDDAPARLARLQNDLAILDAHRDGYLTGGREYPTRATPAVREAAEVSIRLGTEREITTARALEAKLDTRLARRAGESDLSFKNRHMQHLLLRQAFIDAVGEAGSQMLVSASTAYHARWLAPRGCA